MDEDLAARVQRLVDIESARGLFNTYAETLDEPDVDAVTALFAADADLHTPLGSFTGRAEIRKFFAQAFEADPSLKRHFIVNPKVMWVAGGRVRIRSYLLYLGRAVGSSVIGWGTYDDTIDVSGPEPVFASKTIAIHHGTDLATGWALD